jgi:hypothetical protein
MSPYLHVLDRAVTQSVAPSLTSTDSTVDMSGTGKIVGLIVELVVLMPIVAGDKTKLDEKMGNC